LVFGDNREDDNGGNCSEGGGDGIFDDMEYKSVFDAVVVFFEGEQKTRSADNKEIYERHLEGCKRIAKIKKDIDDAENGCENGFIEKECATSGDVIDRHATFIDSRWKD